ncbi:MAG: amino acid adenylation domain-containing protein [Symplocastrum torsivum CPER-KK1]|jgi:aspartate racemase|uniref:Amino acid adenylation domain-containing protein n=1 Tax=Symplocastrum torsivum CPER-KK1 TaxID=450513 RepID=A0A951UB05_9CYAN|nr:amino acid adenylation domain-containing protein [Symplocastrum torsivum CPER-KK1]
MKTIDEFLSELRCLDVKLWNEGDRLRYKAPKETLTPALRQELKERKAEILAFLHKANAATSSNLSPILPVPRDGNLPLSFAQARLWFLAQLEPDSPAYNIPAAFRLTGLLNVTALSQSLNEIVQRHEVLRTSFPSVDGQPKQVISPDTALTLPVIDLRELPPDQGLSEAQLLTAEEAQQPFNLSTGPLFRVKLLRLEEAEHMLLVTMHHIVYDGWSYDIFLRELAALYDAFSSGKPSPLPELPIQYADFAHWQREWLQGEVLESQRDYWKQQLNGNLPILQLLTDYPRPPVQTYQGGYQSLELPKNLTKALKALSQQERVTLFMTLLAAFQTFLYRYTGQEDMIVGTPIAGRNQMEAEGLIGFFVNTLALRTYLTGNPSFQELLGRVREVALGAYAHQDLPFEKLVEELQPERDRSRTPLFQVMFVLQNTPTSALELPGLTVSSLNIDSKTAKFDLTLFMIETAQGLRASLEYNTDLFNAATITRMLGNFQTLLEGIVANPQQRLSDLPLLTAAEQHQLLVEWNNTTKEYPQDKCIHQLFEAQVEQAPDAVAVVFEGEQLTYRELNARANQLAHYLQVLGVGPEVLVGICVERSLEMLVGLLGILKAGGAYVPLDPAYPLERLAFMLEDASVSVLLTQARLVESLPQHQVPLVCLDGDWEVIAQYSEENPFSGATPKNLAYVIYTSGSTGKPKGVLVEHRGLLNLVFWHRRTFAVSPKDRATQLAGSAFDASVWELWPYLSAGASIYIANEQTRVLPQQLRDWLIKNAITISFLPTPLAESILSLDWSTNVALRTLLTGGDKLHNYPLSSIPFELVNNYGPTENTVVTTSGLIPAKPRTDVAPPIGRPIANTKVYLLDEKLQLIPIGIPGELYVSGEGLARGYLNRPDLTAQKFIANPFIDNPSVSGAAPEKLSGCDSALCLYKTGDLARYLPNGDIEFLGRIDEQVKIRGFRIELGEIEALLVQHPDLREVEVIVREDIPGNKFLAAYVVPKLETSPPTNRELRSFLKAKLPDYMVPGAFVFLEAMPLTPNGKIDRRALPIPDSARREQEDNFVAPSTPTEEILAAIWAEVLGRQQVGINDNFFELGGHSMLAARLFAQIEKKLGRNLPLANLFQAPTIKELVSLFNQQDYSSEQKKSTMQLESATNLLNQSGLSAPCSSLIVIQPNGSKPPLFCIHVLGRGLKFYRPLAHHLGLEQPLYGLAAQIMDRKYAPQNRVEDLAAHYIKELRILQSEGPYFLAGVSFGGSVAFEMAQQLVAQGQKVALLALFDTYASEAVKQISSGERFSAHWNNFLKLGPIYVLKKAKDNVKGKIQSFNDKLNHSLNEIGCKFYLGIGRPLPDNLQDFTFQQENNQASKNYVPQVYPGRVTLFRSRDQIIDISSYRDPQLGWGELATGGLERHEVPGTHLGMLQEPHVQVLAEKLKAYLDKAQAETHL